MTIATAVPHRPGFDPWEPPVVPRWGEPERRLILKTRWIVLPDDQLVHSIFSGTIRWDDNERAVYKANGSCEQARQREGHLVAGPVQPGRTPCPNCIWRTEYFFVYHLYRGNELVYVGCTTSLKSRLVHHRRTAKWWPGVDRYECDLFVTITAAAFAESDAIQRLRPSGNSLRERPYGGIRPVPAHRADPFWQISGSIAEFLARPSYAT